MKENTGGKDSIGLQRIGLPVALSYALLRRPCRIRMMDGELAVKGGERPAGILTPVRK